MLTLKGFGFSADSTVSVGAQPCHVVHASDTELRCRTPAVSRQSGSVFDSCFNLTLCFLFHSTLNRLVHLYKLQNYFLLVLNGKKRKVEFHPLNITALVNPVLFLV